MPKRANRKPDGKKDPNDTKDRNQNSSPPAEQDIHSSAPTGELHSFGLLFLLGLLFEWLFRLLECLFRQLDKIGLGVAARKITQIVLVVAICGSIVLFIVGLVIVTARDVTKLFNYLFN